MYAVLSSGLGQVHLTLQMNEDFPLEYSHDDYALLSFTIPVIKTGDRLVCPYSYSPTLFKETE